MLLQMSTWGGHHEPGEQAMISAMGLPERIKEVWKVSGRRQKEILAETGLSRSGVSAWMTGDRTPTLERLNKFADATGATVIIDLDHPNSPRRHLTATAQVATLAPSLEALDDDHMALVTEVVRMLPELDARDLKILRGLLTQLREEDGEVVEP